jgi:uncharacterized DUF497 family protein
MAVRFEGDSRKAAANLRTHGVSFAEAVTAQDDFAVTAKTEPTAKSSAS